MIVKYFESHKGFVEREFTPEIHGDNYSVLAKEFADTNKGAIIYETEVVQPKNKGGRPKKIIHSES